MAAAELAQHVVAEALLLAEPHGHGEWHGNPDVGLLLPHRYHARGLPELPAPRGMPKQEEVLRGRRVVGRRRPEEVAFHGELPLAGLYTRQEKKEA